MHNRTWEHNIEHIILLETTHVLFWIQTYLGQSGRSHNLQIRPCLSFIRRPDGSGRGNESLVQSVGGEGFVPLLHVHCSMMFGTVESMILYFVCG